MNERSPRFRENPLYEKLYHRFSYSGKTVGEMMLCRAREASASVGATEKSELRDLTAEACITRANLLPKATEAGGAVAIRKGRSLFSRHYINPFAALALLISVLILSYLLITGIQHNSPDSDLNVLEVTKEEDNLYAAEADLLSEL